MIPLPQSWAAKTSLFIISVTSGEGLNGKILWLIYPHQEKIYTLTYAKLGQIDGVFEHGRDRGIILKDSGSYVQLESRVNLRMPIVFRVYHLFFYSEWC